MLMHVYWVAVSVGSIWGYVVLLKHQIRRWTGVKAGERMSGNSWDSDDTFSRFISRDWMLATAVVVLGVIAVVFFFVGMWNLGMVITGGALEVGCEE